MIIFDNCVLSAFSRPNLLPHLKILLKSAIILKEIILRFKRLKNTHYIEK